MAESTFATGAVFRLVDEFSGPLAKLNTGLMEADAKVKALGKSAALFATKFDEAGKKAMGVVGALSADVTEKSRVIGSAMDSAFSTWGRSAGAASDKVLLSVGDMEKGILRRFDGIKTASTEIFAGMDVAAGKGADGAVLALDRVSAKLTATMTQVGALSAEMNKLGTGAASVGSVGRHVRPGQSHGAGGAHLRGPSFHVPGGGHVGGSGDGTVPLVAGLGMLELAKGAVDAAMENEHWTAQMKGNGFTDLQIGDAKKAAWANAASNPNASAIDSMKNILELNKVTGNFDESLRLLPIFSQAEVAIGSIKAEGLHSKLGSGSQILNFARGLEELGVTQMGKTPEEREKNIKLYEGELLRTMQNSRGLFDGDALYALTNNSGGAAQNWDMRMGTVVAPIIGEVMRAGKAGNADYMALKSYAGGHITSDAVASLMKYGLTAEGDTFQDKRGWHLKANSQFAEGMSQNIWDWSTGVIGKLKQNGVNTDDQESMNKLVNEIGSNKSTSALMRMVLEPRTRGQIEKEMNLRDKVPGDVAGILQANDPLLKIDALKKSWTNFETALGSGGIVDTAIGTLNKLTSGLTTLSQFLEAHPQLAKAGIDFTAVAGGILTLTGAVKMLGLALPGGGAGAAGAAGGAAGGAFTIVAKSVALFGLAKAAEDSHIFDAPKRSGLPGLVEGLDPGAANWLFGPTKPSQGGSPSDDGDRPSPADMTDPRRRNPLFQQQAFITGMGSEGSPLTQAVKEGFLAAFRELSGGGMGGAGGMGGGSGFMNASFETSTGGGFGGNPGTPGWWTADKQAHAVSVLMGEGVSKLGATALVSRWMNVESHGGPLSVNPKSGAIGIAQWLGDRKGGVTGDFDEQLHKVGRELHGRQSRALGLLNSGSALGAATGASEFEKAEGYNPRTGMDNFTNRTLQGMGGVHTTAPTLDAPRPKVSPGNPAGSASHIEAAVTQALSKAHIEANIKLARADEQHVARFVTKHQAIGMRFPTSVGEADGWATHVNPGTPRPDVA